MFIFVFNFNIFHPHQFDIEDVLNFVAPYGILTNSSVANFKTAVSGTANLAASSRGAFLCQNEKNIPRKVYF